ncbi:hypothetical protein OFL98_29280, partial [Escherichia coli]|nr:hypothetical protein [Escherichia coli]
QRNVAEIVYEGVDAQLALQNRLADERLSITRRGQARELEARRRAGMPELEYIAERTRLAEQAAQDEFDARVKGLKKGSPEYLAA